MEQKNLILAIALSVLIIVGWQFYLQPSDSERARLHQQQQQQQQQAQPAAPSLPQSAAVPPVASRKDALEKSQRVRFKTSQITGSIALRGARFDDVQLVRHHESVDPKSDLVSILSPEGSKDAYYGEFGWVSATPGAKVPGPDTVWSASSASLAPGQTVTLSWDNGEGLVFAIDITLDDNFLFTVKQRVENKSDKAVTLAHYGLVVRHGQPTTDGIYILHEGPYGVFDGRLKELKWSDLKGNKQEAQGSTGGWLGFTDKYWMATLIPNQKDKVETKFSEKGGANDLRYQADFIGEAQQVAPGASLEDTARLFAGAKIVKIVDQYREQYGIDRFDLTIDWGWFWFFTKPLFWLLDRIFGLIGNFGIAIMVLTVIVKAVFFPLANKSYTSMTRMKALQPEFEKLRERFADDKVKMNQELMALYKREKVNPAAGCLPVLLQIPVFFALYKVLYTTIEMRHQPFFGWIHDLAAPDPLTLLQGFGLFHWDVPPLLHTFDIGIWPLIMGATMYLQQQLNPQPADPVQARIFQWMPIVFTFMLGNFAVGLVIYWAWNNLLSMTQQYLIMRRLGVPVVFGGKAPPPPPKPAAATADKPPPAPAKPAAPERTQGNPAAKKKRAR